MTIAENPFFALPAAVATACAMVLAAWLGSGPAAAQAFDCSSATRTAERTVCAKSRLRSLDTQMSEIYEELHDDMQNRSRQAGLQRDQRRFLEARNACLSDFRCIEGAYLDQIEVLQAKTRHEATLRH